MNGLKWVGKFLFADDRKLSKRILIAALACFAFVLTFMLVGPIEIFFANTLFFEYTVAETMLPVLLTGLAAFLALFGISFALRGRVFNWYVSLLTGLSVASYIQVLFLNSSVGLLDGTEVLWNEMTIEAVLGLALWAFVVFVVFTLANFSKKIWRSAVTFLCILICVMQLTNMMAVIFTSEIDDKSVITVTRDGDQTFSDENNVIVLVADTFDIKFTKEVMENDPQYFDEFDGFTWYKNTTAHYSRTYPSVAYLFTGEECNYDTEYEVYMENAWKDNHFLEDIKDAGYTSRIYAHQKYVNTDSEYMAEYTDNYKEVERNVYSLELEKQMINLSLYRNAPVALKPFFETDTSEINSAFELVGGVGISTNDANFYKRLKSDGITVDSDLGEKGTFTYYHFKGCHTPYNFDENCQLTDKAVTSKEATRGVLTNISEFLRQLKEQGIYDSSTIIITGDHSTSGRLHELDTERVLTLFYKPAGATGELKEDNSPQQLVNVRATVLKAMGADYLAYGTPIDEVKEGDDVVRYFHMSAASDDLSMREGYLITYEIKGDANDFSNWKKVDKKPIEYPFLTG